MMQTQLVHGNVSQKKELNDTLDIFKTGTLSGIALYNSRENSKLAWDYLKSSNALNNSWKTMNSALEWSTKLQMASLYYRYGGGYNTNNGGGNYNPAIGAQARDTYNGYSDNWFDNNNG
jgi:hypothetical protein